MILVIHLHFLICLFLFIQFLVVLLDGYVLILEIGLTGLSLNAYSSPPGEEDELGGHCFML